LVLDDEPFFEGNPICFSSSDVSFRELLHLIFDAGFVVYN